ncbi:MAG: arylsulfatase [Bryobacteraceae bacterium]
MANTITRRGALLSMASGLSAARAVAAPVQPNIVYILADDLGYGDLHCYNPASKAPTPHLDRFASQGVRFTDAHSPSSVCTPTRYGILTGRYCWRSRLKKGVLDGYSPALIERNRLTVPALLKQHGYATAGVGKWHLGLGSEDKTDYSKPLRPGPLDYGFDSYFGIPASLDMPPYLWLENDRAAAQPTGHIDRIRRDRGIFWREGAIAPGFKHEDVLPALTKRACDTIRAAERPFFLYLPLSSPHTPWLPGPAFQHNSAAGPYGDFVTQTDDAIGQVLRTIDERNLSRDTLVIVASDNGAHWLPEEIERWGHRANDGLRGQKADAWEGGHRIPFLARWPGKIHPGTMVDETICLTDLMATVADLLHVPLPADAGEDSFSILPLLLGLDVGNPIREATVHHSKDGLFAIRQAAWKLVDGRGSGGFSEPAFYQPKAGEPEGELYHVLADPAEKNNLFLQRPEIARQLKALLEKYKADGRSRPL